MQPAANAEYTSIGLLAVNLISHGSIILFPIVNSFLCTLSNPDIPLKQDKLTDAFPDIEQPTAGIPDCRMTLSASVFSWSVTAQTFFMQTVSGT